MLDCFVAALLATSRNAPVRFRFRASAERIALRPARPRDSARLLVVAGGEISDRQVLDLPDLLRPGDVLVFNDTKVIPAQLEGRRGDASVGATLHKRDGPRSWWAFLRNAKRVRPGDPIDFGEGVSASAGREGRGRVGAAPFPRWRAGEAADRAGRAHAAAALHRFAAGRWTRQTGPTTKRCSRARKARSPRRPPRSISPAAARSAESARNRIRDADPACRRRHLPPGQVGDTKSIGCTPNGAGSMRRRRIG